jgi:hypothetical protein
MTDRATRLWWIPALALACGPGNPGDDTTGDTSTSTPPGDTTVEPTPTTTSPTTTTTPDLTTSSTSTSEPDPTTTLTSTSESSDTGDPPPDFCAPGPTLSRRLTSTQYLNVLRDLLPGVDLPQLDLPPDGRIEGFENIAEANPDSPAVLDMLDVAAGDVAIAAATQGGPWLPCPPDGGPDPETCGHEFLPEFAARAWRHPLTADQQTALLDDFDALLGIDGFAIALRSTLRDVFAADDFHHVHLGAGTPVDGRPGVVRIDAFELAARMSFFLWDTLPDAFLRDAAAAGLLDDPVLLPDIARTMLADPRGRAGVARLTRQWLYLHALEDGGLLPADVPPDLHPSLRGEHDRFIDFLLDDGGTLTDLLTSPVGVIDGALGDTYGVTAQPEFMLTTLEMRPGLLTRAAWLAPRAVSGGHSPFQRGWRILDSFLCFQLPPPPPDIDITPPDLPPDATTRERYDTILAEPACAGCHIPAHNIGYGLEHHDILGAWQDQENGHPIDASGEILPELMSDPAGPFDGAAELMQRLAASHFVHDCVARKFYLTALGRTLGDADACGLQLLQADFFTDDGDLADLLVAIVVSDGFRHRRE